MSPRFLFTINEIGEHPAAAQNVDNLGHWMPSTMPSANRRVNGGVSGKLWFCDTQQIYELPTTLPASTTPYKQFSVYFAGGYGFWILRGDATSPPDDEDWFPLRFDHSDQDYSSFLTNAGQHSTLRLQRHDQAWPTMLLPDIYHAQVQHITQAPSLTYGGITGELPIFLALLALSMPREFLPTVLPTLFTDGEWRTHSYRYPRINKRGVVVVVYTCPTHWSGGSTPADLESYEHGRLGKYYT